MNPQPFHIDGTETEARRLELGDTLAGACMTRPGELVAALEAHGVSPDRLPGLLGGECAALHIVRAALGLAGGADAGKVGPSEWMRGSVAAELEAAGCWSSTHPPAVHGNMTREKLEALELACLGADLGETVFALAALEDGERKVREADRMRLEAAELLGKAGVTLGVEAVETRAEPAPMTRAVVPPYSPFPVQSLPTVVRAFVEEAAADLGADAAFVAVPALSVLGAAVGLTRRLRVRGGWSEPPILWTALVARSGSGKSPGMEKALAPLREAQSAAIREHREADKAHAAELLEFERRKAQHKAKGGIPPERPEPPKLRHLFTSDATVEKLAELLAGNPRGLLVCVDELAGWFQRFDRYGNGGGGDAAQYLSLHRAGSVKVDRVGAGMRWADPAAAWVSGTIQPGRLRDVLTREHLDSGLAARFLWACPPTPGRGWADRDYNPEPAKRYAELVSALMALTPAVGSEGGGAWEPAELTPDRGALALFRDWYDANGRRMDDAPDCERAALSKLEAVPARLSVVLHECGGVSGKRSGGVVGRETMRAAVSLADWFRREAARVYALLAEDRGAARLRAVAELAAERGGTLTAAELHELRRRTLAPTPAEAEALLRELHASGLGTVARPAPGRAGGRPRALTFSLDLAAWHRLAGDGAETPRGDVGSAVWRAPTCRTEPEPAGVGGEVDWEGGVL